MRSAHVVVMVVTLVAGGCTHWGTANVYGERQEVGRKLVGAPQATEDSSTSLSAKVFGESGQSMRTGNPAVAGNAFGTADSTKRTHCVQQPEIDYL